MRMRWNGAPATRKPELPDRPDLFSLEVGLDVPLSRGITAPEAEAADRCTSMKKESIL